MRQGRCLEQARVSDSKSTTSPSNSWQRQQGCHRTIITQMSDTNLPCTLHRPHSHLESSFIRYQPRIWHWHWHWGGPFGPQHPTPSYIVVRKGNCNLACIHCSFPSAHLPLLPRSHALRDRHNQPSSFIAPNPRYHTRSSDTRTRTRARAPVPSQLANHDFPTPLTGEFAPGVQTAVACKS